MHVRFDPEFFLELADERGLRVLAGLDVTTRQRPAVRVGVPTGASMPEKQAASAKQRA